MAMKILDKEIKLVIFDLDGTLIASTSIWSDIDKEFFHKRGMEIPPTYGMEIAHIGLAKAAELTCSKYVKDEKPENVMKEWHDMSLDAYANKIPLKDNAKELLEKIASYNIPIALATANSEEIYGLCLKRLGIDKYFSYIADVNSCKEGKGSPEIYDKIKDHFHVLREETLIFEDMLVPMTTAFKANYNVVGVYDKTSTLNENKCKENSHLFIHNFDEIISLIK